MITKLQRQLMKNIHGATCKGVLQLEATFLDVKDKAYSKKNKALIGSLYSFVGSDFFPTLAIYIFYKLLSL